ncbi:hypothetical protein, partial [Nitrobacter sp. 62-13]|uniref:hypothetical protein n=1 Tax=Nitrobacter sp. 62-13 TaxID=1895797 RepID=UPI000AAF860A
LVEKKPIQFIGEIIVVRHISSGKSAGIVLSQAANNWTREPNQPTIVLPRIIPAEEVHEIPQRAALKTQRAVHVGLAKIKVRMKSKLQWCKEAIQPYHHLWAVPFTIASLAAVWPNNTE